MSQRLPPLPTLKDILRIYGIRAQKKLSQNFILDPKTLSRLSKVTGSLYNKTVVEVGPGPGGITRAILEQGAQKVEASGNRLSIKIGDCLHFNTQKLLNSDLKSNWPDQVPNIRLIGNLPFNVATPVPSILTFQHEVAYRLIAPPGDKHRCRLSVMAQNYAKIDYKYTLPGAAFVPTPEVNVGVAVLIPLSVPYIDVPFKFLERVVTTIMMHKQKSVFRTSLRLFPSEVRGKMAMQLLDVSGVSKDKRPLDLTMDDFARITYTYQDMIQNTKM
ncbi:TFB1M [Lepeophtheirus salmonis]|uniref:rRNA adenine N(6)-methyltransferase n=1 Tax=Lepeophtheirus salmonis TaxID=72036 RepID=A0A7R8CUU6_LEPSM|nr:TFB1M [Lepeophtheirus salmonis]CAF2938013.1 TFB1M [Lepeophtheirus salmonis]